MSAQIIGPFPEYRLVVRGYSVPFVDCRENDGGTVTFIMDGRLAWTIPAGAFEDVAEIVATAYALGLGLPCAPDENYDVPDMTGIPAVMRPHRVREIGSVETNEEPDGEALGA